SAVAKRLGVRTTDPIDIKDPATLKGMVISIIIHENGGNPYPSAIIDEGVRRALA
ncbi:structural protein P5, partial [Pseudomonas mosselii]|nr:structural protein P5 [Pseudomonas mosselii]